MSTAIIVAHQAKNKIIPCLRVRMFGRWYENQFNTPD
jgi:hypothetical protein